MKYIDIYTMNPEIRKRKYINITVNGTKQQIYIAEQKTGYGKKHFFVCPVCGKRRVKLYLVNEFFKCAECAHYNPYKGIQNGTKGGYSEIEYRMQRYAKENDIEYSLPFDFTSFFNDPRYRLKRFRKKLVVLQALENIRFQNIFFKTIYKPIVIKKILNGSHPMLKYLSLLDLKTYIYDFNKYVIERN